MIWPIELLKDLEPGSNKAKLELWSQIGDDITYAKAYSSGFAAGHEFYVDIDTTHVLVQVQEVGNTKRFKLTFGKSENELKLALEAAKAEFAKRPRG